MKRDNKTIHFVSLGCAKNRVDTEVMAGIAVRTGLRIVPRPDEADFLVVNTCAFIDKAREESVAVLLDMAAVVKARGGIFIAAGCMAKRYAETLAAEMPELDHLIGTGDLDALADIIAGTADRIRVRPEASHFLQGRDTPRFIEPTAAAAFVKIADGCSRKCAFCAIPGIRGRAKSRPVEVIVEEVKQLAAAGICEINLVAQDTTAYGRDLGEDADLTQLLHALHDETTIPWIRLLYLYPGAVDDALLETISSLERVVPYLDIPIQHASDTVLKQMRRGHDAARLKEEITRIREQVPGAYLRTAVLVGYPGETAADFQALLRFIEWAKFDHLGAFRYSPEEGTHAFDLTPRVSKRDAYNRYRKVMALQRKIGRRKKRSLLGQALPVLVEGAADDEGYVKVGRHIGQAPEVDGVTYIVSSDAPTKTILNARVTKVGDFDIVVEPV
jgi:ribosomal protein S12 methylthiotransferase